MLVEPHERDDPFNPGRTYAIGVPIYGRQVGMTAFMVSDQLGPDRSNGRREH